MIYGSISGCLSNSSIHSLNMSSYWCYQVKLRVQDYFTGSCYIISIVQQVCRLVDVFVLVFYLGYKQEFSCHHL